MEKKGFTDKKSLTFIPIAYILTFKKLAVFTIVYIVLITPLYNESRNYNFHLGGNPIV